MPQLGAVPVTDPDPKPAKGKKKPSPTQGQNKKQDEKDQPTSTQAANARALAILVAMLVRGELLRWGREQMEAAFDFSSTVPGSPPNAYLFAGRRPAAEFYLSKIGIFEPWYSEAAYILAKGTPPIRATPEEDVKTAPILSYVLVALQARGSEVLEEVGKSVDEELDRLNK
jgi:hypothetical protein